MTQNDSHAVRHSRGVTPTGETAEQFFNIVTGNFIKKAIAHRGKDVEPEDRFVRPPATFVTLYVWQILFANHLLECR